MEQGIPPPETLPAKLLLLKIKLLESFTVSKRYEIRENLVFQKDEKLYIGERRANLEETADRRFTTPHAGPKVHRPCPSP